MRKLTEQAQEDRDDYEITRSLRGGCTCFINAPCADCMHPGNPNNQEDDDSCWEIEE